MTDEKPHPKLRNLYSRSKHSLLIAQILASKFNDASGIKALKIGLKSKDVQTRANTLNSMFPITDDKTVHFILPLAHDEKFYVLQRFEFMVKDNPHVKEYLVRKLNEYIVGLKKERQARVALVLLLLGHDDYLPAINSHIRQINGPLTSEVFYEYSNWCNALVRKGYKSGFEGGAHLIPFYVDSEERDYFWHTVGIFTNYTPFKAKREYNSKTYEDQTAERLVSWYESNKGNLIYDKEEEVFYLQSHEKGEVVSTVTDQLPNNISNDFHTFRDSLLSCLNRNNENNCLVKYLGYPENKKSYGTRILKTLGYQEPIEEINYGYVRADLKSCVEDTKNIEDSKLKRKIGTMEKPRKLHHEYNDLFCIFMNDGKKWILYDFDISG
ncbi:hypothetical protein BVX98_05495 [bacterium F11]|nr:hypothetical protein BVX98_05495 [bacterium F11]